MRLLFHLQSLWSSNIVKKFQFPTSWGKHTSLWPRPLNARWSLAGMHGTAMCRLWEVREQVQDLKFPQAGEERVNPVPISFHCVPKRKSVQRLNWLKPQPTERDSLPEPRQDSHLRKQQWTVLSQTHSLITQHSKCLARSAEWPSLGRNPGFRWRKEVKRNQYWDWHRCCDSLADIKAAVIKVFDKPRKKMLWNRWTMEDLSLCLGGRIYRRARFKMKF